MLNKNQLLGRRGEEIAVKHLKKNGYKILARNYRCSFGEIDIIGRDGTYISFIEVKTRSGKKYGCPSSAVDRAKQKQISMVAHHYLAKHALYDADARFDVVAIIDRPKNVPHIELIKNAFEFCG